MMVVKDGLKKILSRLNDTIYSDSPRKKFSEHRVSNSNLLTGVVGIRNPQNLDDYKPCELYWPRVESVDPFFWILLLQKVNVLNQYDFCTKCSRKV